MWINLYDKNNNLTAPSEDSDQAGHSPSLIGIFHVRLLDNKVHKLSPYDKRGLLSDWMDAQAAPSLDMTEANSFNSNKTVGVAPITQYTHVRNK